jgi:hypothetical protein
LLLSLASIITVGVNNIALNSNDLLTINILCSELQSESNNIDQSLGATNSKGNMGILDNLS